MICPQYFGLIWNDLNLLLQEVTKKYQQNGVKLVLKEANPLNKSLKVKVNYNRNLIEKQEISFR